MLVRWVASRSRRVTRSEVQTSSVRLSSLVSRSRCFWWVFEDMEFLEREAKWSDGMLSMKSRWWRKNDWWLRGNSVHALWIQLRAFGPRHELWYISSHICIYICSAQSALIMCLASPRGNSKRNSSRWPSHAPPPRRHLFCFFSSTSQHVLTFSNNVN